MMKKLALKLVVFCLLLLLIKAPFYYALSYKDELRFHQDAFANQQFNTVFIGSSRITHAVLPAYFDSLTGHQTRSYNFGMSGGLPPETFDWCEELMASNPSVQYVFFELSGGFVPEFKPWTRLTLAKYLRALESLPFDKFSVYNDNLVAEFFNPHLSVGQIDYNLPPENVLENKEPFFKNKTSPQTLQRSHFYNQVVETGRFEATPSLNIEYWERVLQLIEIAESKRIHLYFFVPPRLETEREPRTVYPIYQKLDKKYKLRVAHDAEELYQDETSIDDFHLNHKGAMRFTKNMAETFNQQK